MIQEIFLALLGHDGEIFKRNEEEKIQMCQGIFTQYEIPKLNKVLEVASQYCYITKYCDESSATPERYKSTLGVALRNATEKYVQEIVNLESQFLDNPNLGLSHLVTSLQDQTPVLSTLVRMLKQIEEENVSGCLLLDVIHKCTQQCVHTTRDVMERLEQAVCGALYTQLIQWLLYGSLLDPHNEFFLQKEKDSSSVVLCAELLPDHIPPSLVQKVLFIGQAVRDFEATTDQVSTTRLLEEKESQFLNEMTNLRKEKKFSLIKLSETLENIRVTVSKHLYQAVISANLPECLDELKAILLLGRGELFHTFQSLAKERLDGPVDTCININLVFQTSGEMVNMEEELLERFTVTCIPQNKENLPSVVLGTKGHGDTGWGNLSVEYHSPPLLRLILGTDIIHSSYNKLFQYLLCVSRVQQKLHSCWLADFKHKRQDGSATLRHQMTLLIDGLQYYLQVDVLEGNHFELMEHIKSCEDYQEVQLFISSYLNTLSSCCFLNQELLSKCFSHIFSLCNQLSDGMKVTDTTCLTQIKTAFGDSCKRLFLILHRMQAVPSLQQHILSLLARIDYNMYYRNLYVVENP